MKEKKPFLKVLGDISRGVLKSLPIGNVLVELSQNKKAKKLAEPVTLDNGEQIPAPVPHSYVSIAVQVICIIAIVYAFFTGQIDVKNLLNLLLNFFI